MARGGYGVVGGEGTIIGMESVGVVERAEGAAGLRGKGTRET